MLYDIRTLYMLCLLEVQKIRYTIKFCYTRLPPSIDSIYFCGRY